MASRSTASGSPRRSATTRTTTAPTAALDVTGNLLRDGIPFGTHDTHGWPSFAGWPVNDTNTHQQIYYGWLQRAWMSGLRLVVAQTVEDEPICRIEPVRSHSCSETKTIRLEIDQLRDLEDYVDAQEGGRGRGWLRIVEGPREARRVIERGKLAVVIGVESSDPFGCSEPSDCTRADVDRGLARMRRLGRSQHVRRPLGRQRVRRRRARGRHQGRPSSTSSTRSRPATTSTPAPVRTRAKARSSTRSGRSRCRS